MHRRSHRALPVLSRSKRAPASISSGRKSPRPPPAGKIPPSPCAKQHCVPTIISFVSGTELVTVCNLNKHGPSCIHEQTRRHGCTSSGLLHQNSDSTKTRGTYMPVSITAQSCSNTIAISTTSNIIEPTKRSKRAFSMSQATAREPRKPTRMTRYTLPDHGLLGNNLDFYDSSSSFVDVNIYANNTNHYLFNVTSCHIVDLYLYEYNTLSSQLE